MTRRSGRLSLVGLLTLSMAFSTGCDQLGQLAPLITGLLQSLLSTNVNNSSTASTGTTTANTPTATNPNTGTGTGTGTTNPTLGGTLGTGTGGAGTPQSPATQVPPPADSASVIQKIQTEYGITVTGVSATGAPLAKLATGLPKYPKSVMAGMKTIDIPRAAQGSGLLGTWLNGDVVLYDQGGDLGVTEATVLHELGHHATLFNAERQTFMANLVSAVGTADSRHPTNYSKSSDKELVAEVLSFTLCGSPCDEPTLPTWQLEAAANTLIQTEMVQPAAADGVTLQ